MEDIDVTKKKAELLIQDRIKSITEKPYPYNHNEVNDLVDELTEIYMDCEVVNEDLQNAYDEICDEYDELKDNANGFVNDVDDIANNMDAILDSDNSNTDELKNEVGKLLRLCKETYWY